MRSVQGGKGVCTVKDDQRKATIRRDLNDLVRDESGHLSSTKIGTLIGQWLAIKMILEHGTAIIANWDSLTVLFSVLIAPEIFKKLLNMKYSNGAAPKPKAESN